MANHQSYLETERLLLKPITINDASFYLTLMNSPKWLQFIGDRGVYTLEDAEIYVQEKMISQWNNLGYGNYIVWLKTHDSSLEIPIGAIGIFTRPGLEFPDLGFAFLESYEGKGYATEGSLRLLQEAKEKFDIKVLQAITDPSNFSCQRLLDRLQFKSEGSTILPNQTKPVLLFKLLL